MTTALTGGFKMLIDGRLTGILGNKHKTTRLGALIAIGCCCQGFSHERRLSSLLASHS